MFIKLYVVSLFIFLTINLCWIGIIAKNIYAQQIGFLMADKIRWGAVFVFYALYILGLVFFAIMPAFKQNSWNIALLNGSLFGLVCYATYDLTNLATLKGWPLKIVIYDLIWGSIISAFVSLLTFWIGTFWKRFF
ncbi:MAG: DUF2177 family protein [Chlamydiae bacterium]|nr:DUF2177 family protein [Chlamydiota bacterium]